MILPKRKFLYLIEVLEIILFIWIWIERLPNAEKRIIKIDLVNSLFIKLVEKIPLVKSKIPFTII